MLVSVSILRVPVSDGARTAALGLDIKVVLIDGVELAQLRVENNLGVSVKQVYEVKQLDSDYFAQEGGLKEQVQRLM